MSYSKYNEAFNVWAATQRQDALERQLERRIKEYTDYASWYDEGPGSESWKRTLYHDGVRKIETSKNGIKIWGQESATKKINKWPKWKRDIAEQVLDLKEKKKKKKEQFLEDELFEI